MSRRLEILFVVAVLVVASVAAFAFSAARVGTLEPTAPTLRASAATPYIWYNYSGFFNVPYGEWWDMRTNYGYGDEPLTASCFNATSVADGTCTANVAGRPRVASYPYMNWAGSGTATSQGSSTSVYAPYRVAVAGYNTPGYNLSQPVFLPVFNYAAAPGNVLSFNWNMQYMNKADFTRVTTTLGCYPGTGGTANDGYQLISKVYLTLDNQEAARLFGATVSTSASTIQSWWNTNTLTGCSGSNKQSGPLETSVNNWFANEANGKYDIYNGYAAGYTSLYTNITATVVSGGATGTTRVYLEHGAWGTEILFDRWAYWGNQTYTGSQLNSGRAKGWWGMENGWWEGVHYTGSFSSTAMNFNLNGVLQYHFQEHSDPGADGVFRSSTNPTDADDTPYWTWGPVLVDYVLSSSKGPYSELNRFSGQNYVKTTPGSGDYGTNTSFDYTPVAWPAKSGEYWNFVFPTNSSGYYQNPATASLGTDPMLTSPLPAITAGLSLEKLYPAGYGTWTPGTGTWSVTGGTPETWPASTGPGTYPYAPVPAIFLHPANLPPGVTTMGATGITATAATLNGNLNTLGSATTATVGFRWGTSASLATYTNVTVGSKTAAGAFSQAVSGLTPGTTYYFRAWANGVGFVTGSIVSFTAGVYPPAVSTVAASGTTASTAMLNGDLTDKGSASSVTVGFLWGTSPTLAGATNVTVGPLSAVGTFNHALSGLSAGTTYYFQAWGNGDAFAAGSILGFTTSAPPTVVTNAATSLAPTSAILNGDLTALGTSSTVTVGFYWGTSPTLTSPTNTTVGPNTQVGAFSSPLSGLTKGTTYYFQAWANGAGFATGSIMSFTTPVLPPAVTTDAATSVSPSGATLNGHTTSLGSGSPVGVGFLWGISPTLAGATNVSAGSQSAVGSFSTGLSTLTAGTTYYFEAWANGDGFATGSILSFTATTTPPGVTTNAASPIGTTTATLNGNLVDIGSATNVEVGFSWGLSATLAGATNDSITNLAVAGSFTDSLTGLTKGTTYYFRAWANGDGFVTGSILSFTTAVIPPSVTTNAAGSITTSGALLNGDLTSLGTAASVQVGFLWGASATLVGSTNVSVGSVSAVGVYAHALTSLLPGTTYYFQAWGNGDGFTAGAILSFRTLVTPPTVATNAASAILTNGATLNGATSSLGTASSVSVGFLWSTSASLASPTNVSAGTQTAAAAFSSVLASLTPSTTYYYAAWAVGDGYAEGTIVSFTTATPPSPPVVATNAATGITTAAATLNGATTSLGTASSVAVGFLWGTSSSLSGATNVTVTTQTVAAAFSRGLASLTPSTTYYFRAWANGDGFAMGAILHFTTSSAPPPVTAPTVTSSTPSAVTSTGATLNGNLVALGSASSVTVGFLWSTDSALASPTNVTVTAETSAVAFTAALTGLTPGTTYYFEAWANGDGFVHGTIQTFTTVASTPPGPGPTFLGLPALVGYGLLAAILVIVVVAAAVILLMRRRKNTPPPPPANP